MSDQAPGRRRAKLALTVAFVLFVFGAPFARRILGVESHFLHPWAMYHDAFVHVCEVELVRVHPDGRRERVDRFATASERRVRELRNHLRVVPNRQQAYEAARAACATEPADVRLFLRCREEGRGLVEHADGSQNVCERLP